MLRSRTPSRAKQWQARNRFGGSLPPVGHLQTSWQPICLAPCIQHPPAGGTFPTFPLSCQRHCPRNPCHSTGSLLHELIIHNTIYQLCTAQPSVCCLLLYVEQCADLLKTSITLLQVRDHVKKSGGKPPRWRRMLGYHFMARTPRHPAAVMLQVQSCNTHGALADCVSCGCSS